MAELQVRIHALPGRGLPAQTPALRTAIERAELPCDLHAAVTARLAAAGEAAALCHGDLHLGNLILQADTLYLLDWDKACQGAPAADAARTAVMLRDGKLGGLADSALADPVRAALAWAYVRAYVRAYRRHTGDDTIGAAVAWWLPVATAAKLPFVSPRRRRRVLRRLTRALAMRG
jgi:aminoglycoside phosphotransferase (APT) family kinase protein